FSGSERFQLYDFVSTYGIEEDVFAYSNGMAEKTVLILCNNSPKQISGRIGTPVVMADKEGINCIQACDIDIAGNFVLMTDICSGLQFIQPSVGLSSGGDYQLEPYCHRVIGEFRSLADEDGRWQQLWQRYGDRGRRDYLLDHVAILIEPILELVQELMELTRPDRAKCRVTQLLQQIFEIQAVPALSSLSQERFLEVLVSIVFPDNNLEKHSFAALIQVFTADLADQKQWMFNVLDRFFNHRQLRKLLSCNYYEGIDWFGSQEFKQFCLVILHFQLFSASQSHSSGSGDFKNEIIKLLGQLKKMNNLAASSECRVDNFLQRLDQTPIAGKTIPVKRKGAMKILFVASEATPFAKSGGLADVAGSLPRALRQLGHDVQVVVPCYRMAEAGEVKLAKGNCSIEITLPEATYRASLKRAVYDGVPYWFIDTPEFFDREQLYGTAAGDYPDNGLRFGFFAQAVLEMAKSLDFKPDVIHINDWQTGLIPPLLQTSYAHQDFFAKTKTLLTIHNLGYQGMFPLDLINTLDLPRKLGSPAALEYYGRLSLLKGGINFADLITTVSPTYCHEIQLPERGQGFDGLLRSRRENLSGIINGLDQRIWNPETDPQLVKNYSAMQLRGKGHCKKALQQELGLEISASKALVVVVSRLDQQKGINLIETIWPQLLERDIQFVLLGSGQQQAMKFWQEQQGKHLGQVSINLNFDEPFSHRLYSAADMLLVPSLYEPCGLTQMIALTYGALPVVRRTGGLADTVVDVNEQSDSGYGFVFNHSDPQELLHTIDRALTLYAHRRRWLTIVRQGMVQDFSWGNSAEQYQQLYRQMMRG
ncbi:MAG: glycogen synthase GlgA, partial [Thermodesulfobacteriota bacterium]|nr:glycogen synthase GlgA [Thermodesulfobacteriota bacterium]